MNTRITKPRVALLGVTSLIAIILGACTAAIDETDHPDPGEVTHLTQELAIDSDTLWRQSGVITPIRVCFHNGTTNQRVRVRNVIQNSWEAIGSGNLLNGRRYGVDFTGWGDCPTSTPHMVDITFNNTGTNEVTGQMGRNMTGMNLDTGADDDTIMHEFGHALGFTHEFMRPDYETVDPACHYTDGPVPDLGITGPDTASIMNYTGCGRSGDLTFADVVGFASLYGPMEVVTGSARYAIRSSQNWNYVRGDSTPDVSSGSIGANSEFRLVKVSGSSGNILHYGDVVRLKTNDGYYLKSQGRGAYVIRTTNSGSTATKWLVWGYYAKGTSVAVNDAVWFRNQAAWWYLAKDSSDRLITDTAHDFRLVHLLEAINWRSGL